MYSYPKRFIFSQVSMRTFGVLVPVFFGICSDIFDKLILRPTISYTKSMFANSTFERILTEGMEEIIATQISVRSTA